MKIKRNSHSKITHAQFRHLCVCIGSNKTLTLNTAAAFLDAPGQIAKMINPTLRIFRQLALRFNCNILAQDVNVCLDMNKKLVFDHLQISENF